MIRTSLVLAGLLLLPVAAEAQTPAARDRSSAFGTLGSNKEPIKIDADRLDVFDRDGRAVFEGNVVAVQGDSTVKCTSLTVLYEQRNRARGQSQAAAGAPTPAPAASPAPAAPGTSTPGSGDSAIRKIDCKGPVTIVSKTQVATGDHATFDRVANRVLLTGNVALTDGPNLTRGERLVYDLNTGIANVETAPGGRVRALFVPGGGAPEAAGAVPTNPAPAQPRTAPQPAHRPPTR